MNTLILAIGDRGRESDIRRLLDANSERIGMVIKTASNFDELESLLKTLLEVLVIVVDYDLPSGADDRTPPKQNLPVKLAKSAETCGPCTIIVGPVVSPADKSAIRKLSKTAIIGSNEIEELSENDIPDLIDLILTLLKKLPANKRGLVEFTIEEKDVLRCVTNMFINGHSVMQTENNFVCSKSFWLDLKEFTDDLRAFSNHEDVDNFLNRFRSVGRKTREMIRQETAVIMAISDLVAKAGGAENVWIRFRVPHRSMPATPFEAILRCDGTEDEDDEFQLALSPVYRVTNSTRSGTPSRAPIFSKAGGPVRNLNCVIIDASTFGSPMPRGNLDFPVLSEMPHGREESEAVAAVFEEQKQNGLISEVLLVKFDEDEARQNPIAFVEAQLGDSRWHIVHFVGHSFFRAGQLRERDDAYVFLPGDPLPVPVGILRFRNWLNRACFVYLSSCQSAEVGFIHALAEKGVSTIVGYRWNVQDYGAKVFASLFYRHLFEMNGHRSIEEAFAHTQKTLKDPELYLDNLPSEKMDSRIWAYPMLMMQNVV